MNVDVLNEAEADVDVLALTRLARFVMTAMRLHPATETSLRLVDRPTIAEMNQRWMGAEGPTDVLAFPLDELSPGDPDDDPEDGPEGYLGDIALCVDVAAEQAPSHGTTTEAEVELLLVHGLLHLMGYDHAEPEEHREMFALQDRLLADWRTDGAVSPGVG